MRFVGLALLAAGVSVSAAGQDMPQGPEPTPEQVAQLEELLAATRDWRAGEIVLLPRDPNAPSFPFPVVMLDPEDPTPLEDQARDVLDLDEEDLVSLLSLIHI